MLNNVQETFKTNITTLSRLFGATHQIPSYREYMPWQVVSILDLLSFIIHTLHLLAISFINVAIILAAPVIVLLTLILLIRLTGLLYHSHLKRKARSRHQHSADALAVELMVHQDAPPQPTAEDEDILVTLNPEAPREKQEKTVRHHNHRRFIREMILELKCDLGIMKHTPAGVLVVTKHATKLLRDKHMRRSHIGMHIETIVAAYFTPSKLQAELSRVHLQPEFNDRLHDIRTTKQSWTHWLLGRPKVGRFDETD